VRVTVELTAQDGTTVKIYDHPTHAGYVIIETNRRKLEFQASELLEAIQAFTGTPE